MTLPPPAEPPIKPAHKRLAALLAPDKLEECSLLAGELHKADPADPIPIYAAGLLHAELGDLARAQLLVGEAEKRIPGIEGFDQLRPWRQFAGRDSWGRQHVDRLQEYLRIKGNDRFLISYPKCGRTWLRVVLAQYLLDGRPGDALEPEVAALDYPDMPSVNISHDDNPHWKPAALLDRDKSRYGGKRVAFLARDPRDAVVSNYFEHTKRSGKQAAQDDFSGSLAEFLRHPVGGLESIIAFYNIWAANAALPGAFEIFFYEDLRARPEEEYARLFRFLDLPERTPARLKTAVEFGAFENMREMEKTGAFGGRLKPFDAADPDSFKVRRGKIGGYRDYLGPEDCAWLDARLAADLAPAFARYRQPPSA